MKLSTKVGCSVLLSALAFGGSAFAAPLVCGGTALELRLLTVTDGAPGGLCLTQSGNFNPSQGTSTIATATGLATTFIDKDQANDTDTANETALTGFAAAKSGSWTVLASMWTTYQRVFLGFHFGNSAGAGDAGDPDSFFVELERPDTSGTWALTSRPGFTARLADLSHIDLFGAGLCTADPTKCDDGTPPPTGVPEPASLALVALSLLGAGLASRRKG